MHSKKGSVSRRRTLKALGITLSGVGLAGCSGGGGDGDGDGGDGGGGDGDSTPTSDGATTGSPESVSLTYAHPWPESQHTTQDWILPWINKVENKATSDVSIEHRPAGQLAGAGEYLPLVQDGVIDAGQTGPAYHSDKIPLALVTDLPGQFTDNVAAQKTAYDLTRNFLQGEMYDPLGLEAIGLNLEAPFTPGHWTEEPVNEMSDFEGVSIRSAGGVNSIALEQLGASPVEIGPADVYSAAERGTIDGALFAINTFASWDLDEFITHIPTNINLGCFGAVTVFNQDRWDGLPSDVREAMNTASQELNTEYGEAIHGHRADSREKYGDEVVYEVPEENKQNWTQVLDSVKQDWASNMEDNGEKGQEVLDRWNELYGEYSS